MWQKGKRDKRWAVIKVEMLQKVKCDKCLILPKDEMSKKSEIKKVKYDKRWQKVECNKNLVIYRRNNAKGKMGKMRNLQKIKYDKRLNVTKDLCDKWWNVTKA